MDRGGRFSQSLNPRPTPEDTLAFAPPSRFSLFLRRFSVRLKRYRFMRGAEISFVVGLLALTGIYGAVRGGHLDRFYVSTHDALDTAAQAIGFETANVVLEGATRLKREDVMKIAGIEDNSTLFLIDAEGTRAKLLQNPWITDAAVRKLYPDRLEIVIHEKKPYAIWQNNGVFSIVSKDGTVIDKIAAGDVRKSPLPFVVGKGAGKKASDLYALLTRFPSLKSDVAAAVFVGERRWNLRLKSGIDVRLPEDNADVALLRLVALDREDKILSRDVTVIDLRERDRVTVRLSDEAEAARDAAMKARPKKKGTDT
jgi:cell division protein FtsQ